MTPSVHATQLSPTCWRATCDDDGLDNLSADGPTEDAAVAELTHLIRVGEAYKARAAS